MGGWKAGRTSGLGEKGREGSVRGIFGIFQVHSSLLQDACPPSLLFATWQCSRANGREEKEATRSASCRPRDAGCGRPFASGEEVKAVFLKKKTTPASLPPAADADV